MKKALHASIRQAMLSRGFLTGIIGTACISPLYGSTPVRGPCVSVRRSCDAGAFCRAGQTRARARVWRGSSRRVLACFTAARRARVAHVPRVSRTSGTVVGCHGRRLLAKGVVLRAAMPEGGAKKESGDDMRRDRRHERAVMVSARSLPAVSRIPPRPSPPPLLTDGDAAAKPVAVWQMCRGRAAERCPSRFRTI